MLAIFIDLTGEKTAVDLIPGETLMAAAVRSEIEWVSGACGGSMACATCHARVISRPGGLSPASDDEADLLSGEVNVADTSRLLCQIIAGSGVDGIIVAAPDFTA